MQDRLIRCNECEKYVQKALLVAYHITLLNVVLPLHRSFDRVSRKWFDMVTLQRNVEISTVQKMPERRKPIGVPESGREAQWPHRRVLWRKRCWSAVNR